MKTKYAVTRDGEIIVESDDLEYIKKIKEEYTHRRTGRTTRMIFRALADQREEIVIVARNRAAAKTIYEMTYRLLNTLGSEIIAPRTGLVLENFGKTYRFMNPEEFRSYTMKVIVSFSSYHDED